MSTYTVTWIQWINTAVFSWGLRARVMGVHLFNSRHRLGKLTFKRLLGGNHVFTLDEAAGVLPRFDVLQDDIAR